VGIGPVARIFEVDVNTVLGWLEEASGHVKAVSRYMLHELQVTQVQLDELYVLLGGKKEKSEAEAGTSKREKRRHCWLWGAIDAESKLLMVVEVGDRSLQTAQRVVHVVATGLAPGIEPLFVSDQLAAYGKALLAHYGEWVEQRKEGQRRRKRRWMPLPAWRYAQVVKRRTRRRLVG
jgi:transposase-like protein